MAISKDPIDDDDDDHDDDYDNDAPVAYCGGFAGLLRMTFFDPSTLDKDNSEEPSGER